ncbi:MAG TPA: heavy metal-binding domain-containing protein [Xanthobacteraceae bacterium]
MLVTTTNEIEGHRITQYLGLVRGITVRLRSVIGNIGAGIQSLFGGNISIYTELAEKVREEAWCREPEVRMIARRARLRTSGSKAAPESWRS